MGETLLGRRHHWPIYEAAERHGLPVAIHAGSSYRHPPTAVGWPSYHIEDYVSQSITFQSQLASLLAEGVFKKFPDLKVVMLESGITWLPGVPLALQEILARADHGDPLGRPLADRHRPRSRPLLADAVRWPGRSRRNRATIFEHLGSDELVLFSTDYPHWQFDGVDPLPAGPAG